MLIRLFSLCVFSLCVVSLCVFSLCVFSLCVFSLCVFSSCVFSLYVFRLCVFSVCVWFLFVCVCCFECVVCVCVLQGVEHVCNINMSWKQYKRLYINVNKYGRVLYSLSYFLAVAEVSGRSWEDFSHRLSVTTDPLILLTPGTLCPNTRTWNPSIDQCLEPIY